MENLKIILWSGIVALFGTCLLLLVLYFIVPSFQINPFSNAIFVTIGIVAFLVLFVLFGFYLWVGAKFVAKLDESALKHQG